MRTAAVALALLIAAACGELTDRNGASSPSTPVTATPAGSAQGNAVAPTEAASETTLAGSGDSLPGAAASVASVPEEAAASGEPLLSAVAIVLESSEHGPELCLGLVLTSLPPQCGGPAIVGWSWEAVDGEESVGGVTWLEAEVTGTFDGETFTLASARPAGQNAPALPTDDPFAAPCPEPAEGWFAQASNAPTGGGSGEFRPVSEYVAAQPDGGTMWLDHLDDSAATAASGSNDPRRMVVVATFTGNLAAHEAALRRVWSGALCVALAPVAAANLSALAAEVTGMITNGVLTLPNGVTVKAFGWSEEGDPMRGVVPIDVEWVPAGAQEWLDETYGAGAVVLQPALRPVAA